MENSDIFLTEETYGESRMKVQNMVPFLGFAETSSHRKYEFSAKKPESSTENLAKSARRVVKFEETMNRIGNTENENHNHENASFLGEESEFTENRLFGHMVEGTTDSIDVCTGNCDRYRGAFE